ncbi:hypothetical protein GGP84_001357 [Salinibacter ruber]|nr:hypothetical protein [Salinibacter ruber]
MGLLLKRALALFELVLSRIQSTNKDTHNGNRCE